MTCDEIHGYKDQKIKDALDDQKKIVIMQDKNDKGRNKQYLVFDSYKDVCEYFDGVMIEDPSRMRFHDCVTRGRECRMFVDLDIKESKDPEIYKKYKNKQLTMIQILQKEFNRVYKTLCLDEACFSVQQASRPGKISFHLIGRYYCFKDFEVVGKVVAYLVQSSTYDFIKKGIDLDVYGHFHGFRTLNSKNASGVSLKLVNVREVFIKKHFNPEEQFIHNTDSLTLVIPVYPDDEAYRSIQSSKRIDSKRSLRGVTIDVTDDFILDENASDKVSLILKMLKGVDISYGIDYKPWMSVIFSVAHYARTECDEEESDILFNMVNWWSYKCSPSSYDEEKNNTSTEKMIEDMFYKNCIGDSAHTYTIATLWYYLKQSDTKLFTKLQSESKKKKSSAATEDFCGEITKEYNQYRDPYTPKYTFDSLTHVINKQFLEEKDLTHDTQLVIVQSPLGSGKTTVLEPIIKDKEYVLIIGSRVTLDISLASRLNLKLYLDEKKDNINQFKRVVIQTESLYKLNDEWINNFIECKGILIIDEVKSLLDNLLASTLGLNAHHIYTTFETLVKNSNKVILMDGFIDQAVFNVFVDPEKGLGLKATFVWNKHVGIVNNIPCKVYFKRSMRDTDTEKWFSIMIDGATPERVYIHSSSKAKFLGEGSPIAHIISKKNNLIIHRDTCDKKKKEMFADLETSFGSYDIVGFTPTATVGVNHDVKDRTDPKYIHHKFLYMSPFFGCGVRDSLQGAMRVRHSDDMNVLVDPICNRMAIQAMRCRRQDIIDDFENKKDYMKSYINEKFIHGRLNTRFPWLMENYICSEMEKRWFYNEGRLKTGVVEMLKKMGFNVTVENTPNLENYDNHVTPQKVTNSSVIESTSLRCFSELPDLTDEQYTKLDNQLDKTEEEKLTLEKHRFKKLVDLEALNLDTSIFDTDNVVARSQLIKMFKFYNWKKGILIDELNNVGACKDVVNLDQRNLKFDLWHRIGVKMGFETPRDWYTKEYNLTKCIESFSDDDKQKIWRDLKNNGYVYRASCNKKQLQEHALENGITNAHLMTEANIRAVLKKNNIPPPKEYITEYDPTNFEPFMKQCIEAYFEYSLKSESKVKKINGKSVRVSSGLCRSFHDTAKNDYISHLMTIVKKS